jgi:hypothetical protein
MVNTSKLGWFRTLKNSPRSSRPNRSWKVHIFENEKSQFLNVGPRNILRPELPNEPKAGAVEYGAILHVAAIVRQHVHRTLPTRFLCNSNALRIPAGQVTAGVGRKIGFIRTTV